MATTELPPVYFLSVKDNGSKLQKICEIIHNHFVKKDKIVIAVSSNEAAIYIDQLLWKMPEESFIPHAIANHLTKDLVVITTTTKNVNSAAILVNLFTTIHPDPSPAKLIYELLDLTTPEKEAISRKKHADYLAAGHPINPELNLVTG